MTDLELLNERCKETFNELDLPFAYRIEKVDEIIHLPYVRYWFSGERLTGSDSRTGIRSLTLNVELITDCKRFDLEDGIEEAFHEFEASKSEDFDTTDEVFIESFTFDVIQKIRRN